jgi:hypothetical protein
MSTPKVSRTEVCSSCGKGKLRPWMSREEIGGIDLGRYLALRCDACGESYLEEEAMLRLESRAKELGVWGSSRSLGDRRE